MSDRTGQAGSEEHTVDGALVQLSPAEKQALRLRGFLLAALSSAISVGILVFAFALKIIPFWIVVGLVGAIAVFNAGIFLAFRTDFNLRFADPSLIKLQLYVAITLSLFGIYHAEFARGAMLLIVVVIFLFGAFRMTTREFATLALYTLAGYGLLVSLLVHLRPSAIHNVYEEWFVGLCLAGALIRVSIIGGRMSDFYRRLLSGNRELSAAKERIEHLAARDELTGLYNRVFFREGLAHALAQSSRHGRPLAVFLIDADRFKMINDTLGHTEGDEVLREIAFRIKGCLYESDLIARIGGDEFVVMIEDVSSRASLRKIAQKLADAIARPLRVREFDLPLTVSIGIATAPRDGNDSETLLRNADIAMYRVKEQGGNSVIFYAERMNVHTEERLALESDLWRAVERDELLLYFQPKVSIVDGTIRGVEALLRWRHPRHGLLLPDHFIPLAEETGAIVPIGRWVLRAACGRARHWLERHGLELKVAVNLSPRQFRSATLVDDLDAALRDTGLEPGRLELEITESMVQNSKHAAKLLGRLHERGVTLSMDDFGTGYSSLSHLKSFPLDSVKIDRSFVRDLPHDGDDVAIARAVVAMAHSLGLSVIAEGVERPEQFEFLRGEGCEEYQGYLCSPPLPEDQLLQFVAGWRQVSSGAASRSAPEASAAPAPAAVRLRPAADTGRS